MGLSQEFGTAFNAGAAQDIRKEPRSQAIFVPVQDPRNTSPVEKPAVRPKWVVPLVLLEGVWALAH